MDYSPFDYCKSRDPNPERAKWRKTSHIILLVLRGSGPQPLPLWTGVKRITIKLATLPNSVSLKGGRSDYTILCNLLYSYVFYVQGNTLSNLGFIIAGFYGAWQCYNYRKFVPIRYSFLFIWMGAIGIGSLLFHATLLYSMQLLDEIPMLFSNSQMLYVLWHPSVDLEMVRGIPKWIRSSPIGYYAFSILITVLYISVPSCTLFFQVSYGVMILLMAISLHFYARQIPSGDSVKVLLQRAAIFMISAFTLWNIDNLMCEKLRHFRSQYLPTFLGPLFQFHAWWHVLTMVSGTHSLIAMTVAWCKTNAAAQMKKENIAWKLDSHCNGILPWIHFKKSTSKSD